MIDAWLEGDIPKDKNEEDTFLISCAKKIRKNCKKNPGQLGEFGVRQRIESYGIKPCKNKKISCDWLITKRQYILPDMICEKFIVEVKTLRYFNGEGKRGNQGTAQDKLFGMFVRYSNVYKSTNKKVLIVFCADIPNDSNGKIILDAFQKHDYHDNIVLECITNLCKDFFLVVSYRDLTEKFLIENNLI